MQITLTLILEKHELHLIDTVKEAFKLAGSPNPDYELEYDPFQEIFNNHFLIDDVYAAKDILDYAYEKQRQFQKKSDSEFHRTILANQLRAKDIFDNFYKFCLKEIGEFNNDDCFSPSDEPSFK